MKGFALRLTADYYSHPLAQLPIWPKDRHAIVLCDRVTKDPESTLQELYTRLGLPISPVYAATLREASSHAKEYRSAHDYSLKKFGLTREQILRNYREVFDAFQFEDESVQAR